MEDQISKFKSQNHNSNLKTDLKIRAYKFSLSVIFFVNSFPNKKVYYVIRDQLLRSATSIGANIVEAKSSSSKREFIKFYEIALKSSNETKYWLCLTRDSKMLEQNQIKIVNSLLEESIQISKILASSLLTMKKKKVE